MGEDGGEGERHKCGKCGHMDTRTRDKLCAVGAPDLRQSTGAMETRWLLVFSLLIHGPLEGDGLASLKDEPCPTMSGHLPTDLFPPKN